MGDAMDVWMQLHHRQFDANHRLLYIFTLSIFIFIRMQVMSVCRPVHLSMSSRTVVLGACKKGKEEGMVHIGERLRFRTSDRC